MTKTLSRNPPSLATLSGSRGFLPRDYPTSRVAANKPTRRFLSVTRLPALAQWVISRTLVSDAWISWWCGAVAAAVFLGSNGPMYGGQ
jgi:hypothetical protein